MIPDAATTIAAQSASDVTGCDQTRRKALESVPDVALGITCLDPDTTSGVVGDVFMPG